MTIVKTLVGSIGTVGMPLLCAKTGDIRVLFLNDQDRRSHVY